ncbi:LysE family transporter [Phytomonospora sp. NPDC050363]|uniref:LysE family translocator n=1 Tax=Phytomonospora sp. NPDC050363 TaxID=3155642 RepID=UPI0033CC5207
MAAGSIAAFWGVALVLISTPGADWAFTLGAGLRGGSVLPAVGGLVLGYVLITAVVAAGVGALVASTPAVLAGLTVLGGAYLVWHGVVTCARPAVPATAADGPAGTDWNTLLKGIGVSGLNPKGLLLFLALLPQFTDPAASWPLAGQIGVLGMAFVVTCAVFYTGMGLLARIVLRARPAAARALGRVSGAAMVVLGGTLLAERLIA